MAGGHDNNEHFVISRRVYHYAKFMNEELGIHFPIFGICQGMEYLASFEAINGFEFREFHQS